MPSSLKPFLQPICFKGQLSAIELCEKLEFHASICARGELQLAISPVPKSISTLMASSRSTQNGRFIDMRLEGLASTGERFSSNTFHLTGYNSGSALEGVTFSGTCSIAVIENIVCVASSSSLIWYVRYLDTFRQLRAEVDEGTVVAQGSEIDDIPQVISGFFSISSLNTCDEAWWVKAASVLEHVALWMSLACGTYFRPYIVAKQFGGRTNLEIFGHSAAAEPSLGIAHRLNQNPMFEQACSSFRDRAVQLKKLDPAIQWLLAPGYYSEIRLITAMTALENLLDQNENVQKLFCKRALFEKFATALREVLALHGAPQQMREKINELNRRGLISKIIDLLEQRGVKMHDTTPERIQQFIQARNRIVHRGFYRNGTPNEIDAWEHFTVAREIVVRLILTEFRYSGSYISFLRGPDTLEFPSCLPINRIEPDN